MGFNKLAPCGQGQKLFRRSPPMTILCLIYIYLTCTLFLWGKSEYSSCSIPSNTRHRCTLSCCWCYWPFYLLLSVHVSADPTHVSMWPRLSSAEPENLGTHINITETARWLLHCHSLPELSSISLTNGLREAQRKGIMMEAGRWSSGTRGWWRWKGSSWGSA